MSLKTTGVFITPELEKLIENFISESGAGSPTEAVNELLSAWFSHPDMLLFKENSTKTGNLVHTATSLVTFIVKLNEYWEMNKKNMALNDHEVFC